MAATITLTHPSINGGAAVHILCDRITVSGKKTVIANPNSNSTDELVEVQTQSVENLSYSVAGIHYTGASGTLTYGDVLILLRHKYGGAAATGANAQALLTVTYGQAGSTTNLIGFDGSTTSIPVVLKDFNFPIDTRDSKEGYMPIGSLTFLETA
jgi:hypothetical protein